MSLPHLTTMKSKYKQRYDGEMFEIPADKPNKFRMYIACCDCGLVHRYDWVYNKGRLFQAANRDSRRTGQRRRFHTFPLIK